MFKFFKGAIIFISSLILGCATVGPRAVEDSDDGSVLIIEARDIDKTVENWGLENGFRYVAYRRIGTEMSREWMASADRYSASGMSWTVHFSRVLVIGINNPTDAPDGFNVLAVPEKPHRRMTAIGTTVLYTGVSLVLLLGLMLAI